VSETFDGARAVPFGAMVLGFRLAVERFDEAGSATDPVAAAIPLFEALNWAAALDERLVKDWIPDGKDRKPGWDWPVRLSNKADAEAVRGVRFIRNRIHHQWADALRLAKAGNHYPPRELEWVWVGASDLPEAEPGHDRGREGYERLLEGRAAEYTLSILAETYEFVTQLLEPLGPPKRWIPENL
jgi:hypothetical protein